MSEEVLKYEGSNFLRQRLVLATLSGKSIRINKIRQYDDHPGLKESEANLIRLLDKLTNGSRIEVNETGTSLYYNPGLLQGGKIEHDCNKQRGIGYYLEVVIMLAPFAKMSVNITLKGVTIAPDDPSVDYYKMCVLPLLKKIISSDDLDIKINQRGVWPDGEGEIYFSCPVVRRMRPIIMIDEDKVKRIRGLAYCQKVNPGMTNRMIHSARHVLNKYLPDVYIYTDYIKGQNGSPGYGLVLVSEGSSGIIHAAEGCSMSSVLPEDIGKDTALRLIQEIVTGGCVDSVCQTIPLLFMVLGYHDVSKIRLGHLTSYTVEFLRHMKDFFQVVFKIDSNFEIVDNEIERESVILTSVGIGYSNVCKPNK